MKTNLFIVSALLTASAGLCAGVAAQDDADRTRDEAAQERAELERHLDAKRERIRELAEEMGQLSIQLADGPVQRIIKSVRIDANRAMLGIAIESRSDNDGVYVNHVTPGGPAETAGIEAGDAIVVLGGVELAGMGRDDDHGGVHKLMEIMGDLEPGDAIDVTWERDGKRYTSEVTTEARTDHPSAFAFSTGPDIDFDFSFDGDFEGLEELEKLGDLGNYAFVWHSGPWSDMELVELTPQLGAYFGVDEGLLVVRAPDDVDLGVVDGDVIVKLNGDAVSTPREFTRKLRRSEEGDTVSVDIVRQRGAMTLDAQVPENKGAGPVDLDGDGRHVIIKRHRYSDAD